jgi:hypothetical protein
MDSEGRHKGRAGGNRQGRVAFPGPRKGRAMTNERLRDYMDEAGTGGLARYVAT